ncbi:MAG: S-adenosyl-L-methionine-dependent tRNA 4-demethylwyosine synthase [Promethearchaeota archaeon]|nr:MAG: S-adenosyl-L-methionine-dependent tRNA 4-demethylwyosine synthase [Candidatus Lokiarchaeota archaeon]
MKNYLENKKITNEFVESYTKTTYRIIGDKKHSAIKPCHWLEQRLMTGRPNRNCYKGVFGIESHRCLQNTPSLPFCNHQCVFCWRDLETGGLGSEFLVKPDDPEELVKEMFRHQQDIIKNHLPLRRYIDNYEIMIDILNYMILNKDPQTITSLSKNIHVSKNKIERALNLLKNQRFIYPHDDLRKYEVCQEIQGSINNRDEIELLINRELTSPNDIMEAHAEALIPNHAAISLDGEPLLYPKISDLVEEFKRRKMTTFIVTNGSLPKTIEKLEPLPSQLYVTLPAPNEKIYKKVCRPMIKNGWENINETLELLDSLETRTLVRLTAIRDLNINEQYIDDYIKLIEKANPDFFEIKGFTLQAKALSISERLKSDKEVTSYFPDYDYLENIASQFEERSNFPLIYKNKPSRDFLFAVNWDDYKDPKIRKP